MTVGGALDLAAGEANAITSTSGAVSITGAVTISDVAAYIDFGSEAWTVAGTWTNSTTAAAWEAGTGTVTFTSVVGGAMTFAGANLAEDEFVGVSFTSSAGTAQTFTMATRGLRAGAGTITISDGVSTTTLSTSVGDLAVTADTLTVGAGGILAANSSTLTFVTFVTTGTMTMDGFTVTGINMSTSAGTIALTGWSVWTIDGSNTNVEWTFNPSNAAATVTITMSGLETGVLYALLRAGDQISFTSAAAGAVTYAVEAGWGASLLMSIDWLPAGGGPPGDDDVVPPVTPPVVIPSWQDPATVSLYTMGIGILSLLAGRFFPVLKESKYAGKFKKTGLVMLILGFFAWFFLFK